MKRNNVLIEVGILFAATIVIIDYVFQRCQASIVHVRSALPDFTQGRSLECAFMIGLTGDGRPAFILQGPFIPGHASVMKGFVHELSARMAKIASRLAPKKA